MKITPALDGSTAKPKWANTTRGEAITTEYGLFVDFAASFRDVQAGRGNAFIVLPVACFVPDKVWVARAIGSAIIVTGGKPQVGVLRLDPSGRADRAVIATDTALTYQWPTSVISSLHVVARYPIADSAEYESDTYTDYGG